MNKWATFALITYASVAVAQTQPTTRGQGQDAPPQAHRNDPATVGAVMRGNGGSLFRATLATAPDPNAARPAAVSLFAVAPPEPRTIRKHDQITIIIREESEFSSDGNSEITKDYRLDARIAEFIDMGELLKGRVRGGGASTPIPSVNLSGNRDFQGEAKIDRQDSFVARIQGVVVDVKPNGTCVIQARKRIVTDDEEQEFILTGSLRAADVTVDNTVLSTQIANLELHKNHRGAVRDGTKRGLVPKLLDAINPF
jgi:flagellar L-ring protein precursor FlgH